MTADPAALRALADRFLAYFRLSPAAICRASTGPRGYHDYPDANTGPMHFHTYHCCRCGKEFQI